MSGTGGGGIVIVGGGGKKGDAAVSSDAPHNPVARHLTADEVAQLLTAAEAAGLTDICQKISDCSNA